MNKKKRLIPIIILSAILFGIILFFFFKDYILMNGAERTVKKFFLNIEDKKFDQALQYVWPPEREKFLTSSKILESVSNVNEERIKIRFKGLKYKTLKIDDRRAEINVNGKLYYQFFGATQEVFINRNFKLIKDKGRWYLKSSF